MSRDERSGFSRETKLCFRCGIQVTVAQVAALPASVGTPDVKSTCGVGIIIVLFITHFSDVSRLASFAFGNRIFFSFRPQYHLCGT